MLHGLEPLMGGWGPRGWCGPTVLLLCRSLCLNRLFFFPVSRLPPASRNQTLFSEGKSMRLLGGDLMLHRKTSTFLLSPTQGWRCRQWVREVDGTRKPKTRGSLSAPQRGAQRQLECQARAFPVRISFKYGVDFIFPRCN